MKAPMSTFLQEIHQADYKILRAEAFVFVQGLLFLVAPLDLSTSFPLTVLSELDLVMFVFQRVASDKVVPLERLASHPVMLHLHPMLAQEMYQFQPA